MANVIQVISIPHSSANQTASSTPLLTKTAATSKNSPVAYLRSQTAAQKSLHRKTHLRLKRKIHHQSSSRSLSNKLHLQKVLCHKSLYPQRIQTLTKRLLTPRPNLIKKPQIKKENSTSSQPMLRKLNSTKRPQRRKPGLRKRLLMLRKHRMISLLRRKKPMRRLKPIVKRKKSKMLPRKKSRRKSQQLSSQLNKKKLQPNYLSSRLKRKHLKPSKKLKRQRKLSMPKGSKRLRKPKPREGKHQRRRLLRRLDRLQRSSKLPKPSRRSKSKGAQRRRRPKRRP